jgi:hypothetical protein
MKAAAVDAAEDAAPLKAWSTVFQKRLNEVAAALM